MRIGILFPVVIFITAVVFLGWFFLGGYAAPGRGRLRGSSAEELSAQADRAAYCVSGAGACVAAGYRRADARVLRALPLSEAGAPPERGGRS